MYFTLVIFAQFPHPRATFYCQRTQQKYLAAYETQRFQFFTRSPQKNMSPRTAKKLSKNDQRVYDELCLYTVQFNSWSN